MKMIRVISLAVFLIVVAGSAVSQEEMPLGDLARSMRRIKPQPSHTVIDNDNMSQVMEEVESRKTKGGLAFSIDESGKNLQMTSPDVTCSLSFSAKATSLITDNIIAQELPLSELIKLDGPAAIDGDTLQLQVYNGSGWNVREITVGVTIVRATNATSATTIPPVPTTAAMTTPALAPTVTTTSAIPATGMKTTSATPGPRLITAAAASTTDTTPTGPKLITAAAETHPPALDPQPPAAEKHADVTVLYKLIGTAAPSTITVFKETLGIPIGPDQEWHWSIVRAKGTPPQPNDTPGQ